MKFLRTRFTARVISIFMLMVFLQSIFLSPSAFALTTGPHQPEYISYEQPGAKDMVNLLTGDFNFSLPLLEVPGPEGSFSVPLSYNAGIGPEQEGSWVGLGWTLNAGAITREVNQFPDDASSESSIITMKDLTGVRGWTSAALGFGEMGWNTVQGHYGSLSLFSIVEASYGNSGVSSVGVAGFTVGKGAGFDGNKFVAALSSILSFGATSVEGQAVKLSQVAANVGVQTGIQALMSAGFSSQTPQLDPSGGYWAYNKRVEEQGLFHKDWWIWLDDTRNEQMYGILNLQDIGLYQTTTGSNIYSSVNGTTVNAKAFSVGANYGAASDINYYIPPGVTYREARSPALLALDNFSVKAPGITGNIKPYRLDIGSVSMPRQMTNAHARFAVVPYTSTAKVPFIYDGAVSNSYLKHTGNTTPSFNFGVGFSSTSSSITMSVTDTNLFNSVPTKIAEANHVEWLSNEDIIPVTGSFTNGFMDYFSTSTTPTRAQFRQTYPFGGSRIYTTTTSTLVTDSYLNLLTSEVSSFTVSDAISLDVTVYNSQSDLQSHINPTTVGPLSSSVTAVDITNSRIQISVPSALYPYSGKYFDVRITKVLSTKSKKAIGGFSITGVDGNTYHFGLPIYDYQQVTYNKDKTDSATKYSKIERPVPFANTWLLTGITGPDFVDRNSNGVIDETDWGYWVKLNYGRYSTNFAWRNPFTGDAIDPENTSFTHTSGFKEIYYLNSIETRSHAALFLKEARADNRDVRNVNNSLRLAEIALLTREAYKQLFSINGSSDPSGNISSMISTTSFSSSAANYLIQNAIKRVKFTYTYDLCPGTPNSNDPLQGKLTLTKVSIKGRNNSQILPDYKFEYGMDTYFSLNYFYNPSYHPDHWDGWGLYSSVGTSAADAHKASPVPTDGFAWSLSRITTPLGSTIEVSYERDSYSTISNGVVMGPSVNYAKVNYDVTYGSLSTSFGEVFINNSNGQYAAGDKVRITNGQVMFNCPTNTITQNYGPADYTVVSAAADRINLGVNYMGMPACSNMVMGSPFRISLNQGTITPLKTNRLGGNLRVSSIVLRDEGKAYKTRYLYKNSDGTSTGVASQEPGYAKISPFDFNTLFGYPMTPILYSSVAILSGNLSDDTDFHTREVYEFETPDIRLLSITTGTLPAAEANGTSYLITNQLSDSTSKIGNLKSIKVYDKSGVQASSSTMTYTKQILNVGGVNAYQGLYSEGTFMHDQLQEPGYNNIYYKNARTTRIKYPNALRKITTVKDGFTSETENIAWDFLSGQVVEKNQTSPLGIKTKTVVKPAYSIYPGMGSKSVNISNANMLSQVAATYVYELNSSGAVAGLIDGSASTWSNSWSNYRYQSGSAYTDGGDTPTSSIWRKSTDYAYKGVYTELQSSGSRTWSTSKEFDFTGANGNPNWLQMNSVMRYDHFSLPLEMKDMNNIYSTLKRDINNKYLLASASNANYFEIAYSGAEDWDDSGSGTFFGGEVGKGTATAVYKTASGSETHTGRTAIQLTSGNKSFIYKPATLKNNRVYRVSVWTNSMNGAIYYSLDNGATEQTVLPQAGMVVAGTTWYQINAEIPITTFSSLEVGVKSTSGTVTFDDFRFQPKDAALSAQVYDPISGVVTFSLDNQNMFTKYEYNDRGQLTKTYAESFKYGVKLISENKSSFKRFNINQ